MSKFKVGDRVKLLKDYQFFNESFMYKGDTGTIKKSNVYSYEVIMDNQPQPRILTGDYLELINLSELEQLVQTANAGVRAYMTICSTADFYSKVETNNGPLTFKNLKAEYDHTRDRILSIIPEKPKFEEFVTKEGWLVRLGANDTILIGCQDFNYRKITLAFNYLIRNNGKMSDYYGLSACRTGIEYNNAVVTNYILNWEDADRILKQLEAM